jgi:hypothetical protein
MEGVGCERFRYHYNSRTTSKLSYWQHLCKCQPCQIYVLTREPTGKVETQKASQGSPPPATH